MNTTIIVLMTVAGLWFLSLFFGYIASMSQSFKQTPPSALNASKIKSQQQQTIEEAESKRQKMMEDMKQRISDGYRKY